MKWLLGIGALVLAIGMGLPLMLMMGILTLTGGAQQQAGSSNAQLCTPSWQGEGVTERDLSTTQLSAAATIYAAAQETGAGDAGAIVGIATALQESDLGMSTASLTLNPDGDIGWFQQRAHVGWYADGATLDENITILSDGSYQSGTFFLGHDSTDGSHIPGLLDIDGWQDMPLTDAAQAVQVSAFPNAYAKHEALARSLVARLSHDAAGQILCSGGGIGGSLDCPASGMSTESGLGPDALRALRCVKRNWPQITDIGGKRVDPDSDHHDGNAIDVMIPDWETPAGIALGQQIADWAVANTQGLGVKYVIWRKQIWSPGRADEGWRTCGTAFASCYSGTDPSAAHLNHPHISLAGAAGTGTATTARRAGTVVLPITKGSYRLTARYNQAGASWSSGFHTGLDFAAPTGTPIVAITDATVESVSWHSAYGNLTKIMATDGTVFYYAHQSATMVTTGENVTAGQVIGKVGNTGNSFGSHLHLEVRINGLRSDPDTWLTQQGVRP